jgi:hypothetical protein
MTMTEVPLLFQLLANFGFPVVITLYLLLRFESRIHKLEKAIIELKNVIHEWRIRNHG